PARRSRRAGAARPRPPWRRGRSTPPVRSCVAFGPPSAGMLPARCTHVTRDRRPGLSFDMKVVRAGFASQSGINQAIDIAPVAKRGAEVDMVLAAEAHIDASLDGQADAV